MTYNNRGRVWLKKGNSIKAFNEFNRAIALNPKCTVARESLKGRKIL